MAALIVSAFGLCTWLSLPLKLSLHKQGLISLSRHPQQDCYFLVSAVVEALVLSRLACTLSTFKDAVLSVLFLLCFGLILGSCWRGELRMLGKGYRRVNSGSVEIAS